MFQNENQISIWKLFSFYYCSKSHKFLRPPAPVILWPRKRPKKDKRFQDQLLQPVVDLFRFFLKDPLFFQWLTWFNILSSWWNLFLQKIGNVGTGIVNEIKQLWFKKLHLSRNYFKAATTTTCAATATFWVRLMSWWRLELLSMSLMSWWIGPGRQNFEGKDKMEVFNPRALSSWWIAADWETSNNQIFIHFSQKK